ncbi:MAG: HAMP domain-containing protein [Phycisphaeraceae bacterium]|nr:HAMP domain-containing protein [Phycisphaeraceae bacterium]
MLRRKLLLVLGPLVALLLGVAVVAIGLLQNVLQGMDHINTQALVIVDQANQLGATITMVEAELHDLQLGRKRYLDNLIDSVETLRDEIRLLSGHYLVTRPEADKTFKHLVAALPAFERHVGALATTRDPDLAAFHNEEATQFSGAMRRDILELSSLARAHARKEVEEVISQFRWLVLGLTVVFLLVINLAVLALFRASRMVLQPVERLVDASRQLALEKFDHRVALTQHDEFDELAQAYNQLAEKLQANEKRKIETLGQVALTLNHELNNAIAVIDSQLSLMGRQADKDSRLASQLRQIHQTLERMTHTVRSLQQIRRIVLTDYAEGIKMLDLEKSVRAEQS